MKTQTKLEKYNLTPKEIVLLKAITMRGMIGMGGTCARDLHDDNYTWFRAEDMVNDTKFTMPTVKGLISSLDKKRLLLDDRPDWALQPSGIDIAMELGM